MLLLILPSRVLMVQVLPVLVDLAIEVVHDRLVELLGLHDVVLVALQRLPPRRVFGRIVVLDHPKVLLWHDIAAVVEGLDLVGRCRYVPGQSVLPQVNVALHFGPEQAVRRHAAAARETATSGLVEVTLGGAAADHALAFGDEVVFEIGAHLPRQPLPVLVEHLATDEGEVVELVPVALFALRVMLVLVVDLILVGKEEKFVIQHIACALLGISFVLVAHVDGVGSYAVQGGMLGSVTLPHEQCQTQSPPLSLHLRLHAFHVRNAASDLKASAYIHFFRNNATF